MNYDGWVTIGTRLDSKQLQKDLRDTERELDRFAKSNEELLKKKQKLELELSNYDEEKQKIEELTDMALQTAQNEKQVNGELELEKTLLSQLDEKYGGQLNKIVEIEDQIKRNNVEITRGKEKVADLNAKIEEAKKADKLSKIFSNIGKEASKTSLKVGKWALALIGIRSLYGMIASAVSTITAEDKNLGTDIEYMKWVIAQTLKPLVEWFVQTLYTMLGLINGIVYGLAGFNMLAGKTVEDFKQMKKNADATSGSLKDMKKQLAGFDEMNVLQDTSSASSGGFSVDDWQPGVDAIEQGAKGLDIWHERLDEMKTTLDEMSHADWLTAFGDFGIVVEGVTTIVYGLMLQVEGLVQYILGAGQVVIGFLTGNKKLVEEGFKNMLRGIVKMLEGQIQIIKGVLEVILGFVAGLFVSLMKLLDEQRKFVVGIVTSIWEFIYGIGEKIGQEARKKIDTIISWFVSIPGKIQNVFNGLVTWFGGLWDRIKSLFSNIGTKVGESVSGAFKSVVNSVLNVAENVLNTPIRSINSLIGKINAIPGIRLSTLSTISLPRLAKGGIINQPGRGVMIGGAIAGERGREAVLPLTDSQQMALLGEAIGKYIVVNAQMNNYMNGRLISREIQKINNESDFSYNR